MKVLIIGSSGSLAGMLIGNLIKKDFNITGVDIRESSVSYPAEKFSFYRCCITDKDNLRAIFERVQPTNVIHLACSFNKVRNKKREYEIDICGSENVLDACNGTPSVRQLIFSSSAAAYGGKKDNPLWMKESEPLEPENYRYGLNKKLVEINYANLTVRESLKIVVLRLCLVLGPTFNKPGSAVSILIKGPFLPKFTMETKLQFLHSEDLAELIGLILNDKEISGIFNMAPDSYTVVKDIVPDKNYLDIPPVMIKGLLGLCWTFKLMNIQPASVTNSFYPTIIDPAKLISRYNYKFRYSSREAFEDTVKHNMIPEKAWI